MKRVRCVVKTMMLRRVEWCSLWNISLKYRRLADHNFRTTTEEHLRSEISHLLCALLLLFPKLKENTFLSNTFYDLQKRSCWRYQELWMRRVPAVAQQQEKSVMCYDKEQCPGICAPILLIFEVLRAVLLKIPVFWDTTPWRLRQTKKNDPEDGGINLHQNFCTHIPVRTVSYKKTIIFILLLVGG